MTLDTVALVNDRLAANLDRAFPELVRQMERPLYSGVRRMVPTGADAEDITQEVFIRAYRALSEYSPERIGQLNLPGWLWTIAMNLCRNAARTRSRRPRTVELDRDAYASGPGPESRALVEEENQRFEEQRARERSRAGGGPGQQKLWERDLPVSEKLRPLSGSLGVDLPSPAARGRRS